MPGSIRMVMWIISDRSIPRSFRFMEGFGAHTEWKLGLRLLDDQFADALAFEVLDATKLIPERECSHPASRVPGAGSIGG